MTLAADHVTVPAGGTSSVDVVLDPTIADPGAYSAVVTATPDDGGGTVRTALAYLLEPERVRRHRHDQAARRLAARLAPARPQRLRRAVDLRAALVRRRTRRPDRDVPAAARHLRHRRDLLRPGGRRRAGRRGQLRALVHRLEEHRDRARREPDRPLRLQGRPAGRRRRRDPRRRLDEWRRLHRLHVLRLGRPALRAAVGRPAAAQRRGLELAAQPARGAAHSRARQAGRAAPAHRARRQPAATPVTHDRRQLPGRRRRQRGTRHTYVRQGCGGRRLRHL